MRITTKGQVTIPADIREHLGLLPNTEVDFEMDGDTVKIRKAGSANRRGQRIVEHLRGRATTKMTTDEIMALTRGE
jgi:AbrB family looped-hinge helix DNA binding protein